MGDTNGQPNEDVYLDQLMEDKPALVIPDAGGDNGTDTTVDNTSTDQSVQNQDQDKKDDGQRNEPNKDTQVPSNQSKETSKESAPTQFRRSELGYLIDNKNNIVDESGRILAHAGSHRRMFEDNHRLNQRVRTTTEQLQSLQQEVTQNKLLNGKAAELGLASQEVNEALDIAARMKKGDYLGVTKDLIAKISAKGHNISELLGKDVGDSIDMRAVRELIKEQLAPVTQPAQQQAQDSENMAVAQKRYDEFVSTHAYADVHANALGLIVQRARAAGEDISPSQAYAHLVNYARERGLDFSRDLGEQLQERLDENSKTLIEEMKKRNGIAPLPGNGATTRSSGVTEPAMSMADGDASFNDIIRQSMAENNMR